MRSRNCLHPGFVATRFGQSEGGSTVASRLSFSENSAVWRPMGWSDSNFDVQSEKSSL
jgi:hypothetical protein